MIPGVKAVHDHVDFSCDNFNTEQNVVNCFMTTENLYNYAISYTLDLQHPEIA